MDVFEYIYGMNVYERKVVLLFFGSEPIVTKIMVAFKSNWKCHMQYLMHIGDVHMELL